VLAAAVRATWGASLSAGIVAVLTVADEIIVWTQIGHSVKEVAVGPEAAVVVTTCIAIGYLVLALVRYGDRFPPATSTPSAQRRPGAGYRWEGGTDGGGDAGRHP
jgi:hypothetical protein